MGTDDRIFSFKYFTARTMFSQFAAVSTLTLTNFLEVAKIRLINDASQCSTSHYRSKTILNRIIRKCFTQSLSLIDDNTACVKCLPERNSFLLIRHLIKEQGFRYAFFSGISKSIASHLVRSGMFFPIFELFKSKIFHQFWWLKGNQEVGTSVVASLLTRTITSVVSFPLEISKIRQQSSNFDLSDNAIKSTSRAIFKHPKRYFSIFLQFYQRELYFSGIFWLLFSKLNLSYNSNEDGLLSKTHEIFNKGKIAFFAGGVASILTYPFDIIQTNKLLNISEFGHKNGLNVLRTLKKQHGMSFFTNGLSVRILRGCLINSIYISVYELLKSNEDRLL
jgi:hypothetical protein